MDVQNSFWEPQNVFGNVLGTSGGPRGALKRLLGSPPEALRRALGALGECLGTLWCRFAGAGEPCRGTWALIGGSWGRSGRVLGGIGWPWGTLGAPFGQLWAILGRPWALFWAGLMLHLWD